MQPPPSHSHIRTPTWLSFRLVNTTSTCSPKLIYLPGNSPPAPIPQTLSAARISSPSRPLAAVLFMSTPDPSQAQLRPRHLKPYLQEFCRCNCNHKWIIIPFICTTSSVLSCTIVCTTRPPLLYARYLSRPPLSHAPHSGTLLLPPLTVCVLYGRYPPPLINYPFHHHHRPGVYPHGVLPSLQQAPLSHRHSPITPWVASAPASADQVTRLNSAYTDKWCDFHWTLKVRWCSWECISRNWKSLINEIYGYCYLLFAFVLCLVLCFSYPIMSTCAWAEHAGHHFIYLTAISMQRSSNRSENLLY